MAVPAGGSDAAGDAPPRITRRAYLRLAVVTLGIGALSIASAATTPVVDGAPHAAQAGPTFAQSTIDGRLTVIQARDFYQAHNAFIESQIKAFAAQRNYPLDHSYIEAFAGAGDVVQKLTAAVQADNAPDLLIHTLGPGQLHFLNLIQDVDALENDLQKTLGRAPATYQKIANLDGKWWAVAHFSRSFGFWVRKSIFDAAGINALQDLTDYQKLRDACLRVTNAEQSVFGWGMTPNRSSDGDGSIRLPVYMWGGQVTDETGQLVVLNTDPYRQYAIDALTWLRDIYTNPQWAPMLPPGVGGWTDPSNNEAWLASKIAMTSNGGTLYAQAINDQNPVRDDTYVIPQPIGLGAGARQLQGPGAPMYFFIMKGAKNRDAAEQLIRYLMTPEIYKQMFQISTAYVYPAREWGWDEPEITQNAYAQHVTNVYRKMFDDPSGWTGNLAWPGPPSPQADALENSNFWTDTFGEVLGGKSPAEAIASAHDRAVQTFKDFGAQGE